MRISRRRRSGFSRRNHDGNFRYDGIRQENLAGILFFCLVSDKKGRQMEYSPFRFLVCHGVAGFYLENTWEARLSFFLSNRLFVLSALFVIYPVMMVIFLLAVHRRRNRRLRFTLFSGMKLFMSSFLQKTVPALSILTNPYLSNAMNSKSFFICMLRKIRYIFFKRMLSMRKMARFCCVRS